MNITPTAPFLSTRPWRPAVEKSWARPRHAIPAQSSWTSGPSRGFAASRTRDPRHRRQSRDSQNAKLVDEFPARYPQVHIHFTPTCPSWLAQVEIWFVEIQRQVIAPGYFFLRGRSPQKDPSLHSALQQNGHPIRWTYRQPNQTVARSSVTMYQSLHT